MPDIQLGLNNQETIDSVNASNKFLNRNNQNTASRIVVTDAYGKITTSNASSNIGSHDIGAELDLLNDRVNQNVGTTASPTFVDVVATSINNVLLDLNGVSNNVFVRNGLEAGNARGLMIDENKLLSDKADKTLVAAHPASVNADLKIDYITGDLDTAEKIASAINATNTKINLLITALKEAI